MALGVRDRQQSAPPRGEESANRDSSVRLQAKREPQLVKSRHVITEHIDVGVPAEDAFDQWTQYEKWSRVFKNESAERGGKAKGRTKNGSQAPGRREVTVRAKIGPSDRRWTAQVTGVEPGRRVNWVSKGPLQAMGTTSFHRLDDRLTHVMVEIEYKPSGGLETIGSFLRMQRRRVRRDLRLFKNYVELRGVAGYDQPDDGGGDKKSHGEEES